MSLFSKLTDQYQELWKAFIRPSRDVYSIKDLGPKSFRIQGQRFIRLDLTLYNDRGMKMQCSHFKPEEATLHFKAFPCVIYLHGNSSSRLETLSLLGDILPLGITVFTFDFCGSGLSDGEYVSLGWWEREDLSTAIAYLRTLEDVSYIALWGRSMGAVTALLHGYRDPSIAGMVIDSPFSNLRMLAEEVVEQFMSAKLPKFITSTALSMIRSSILNKVDFDIDHLNPIDYAHICYIPALFIAADNDTFIRCHHTQNICERYAGDKSLLIIPGDHNSERPRKAMDSVILFFHNTMRGRKEANTPGSNHAHYSTYENLKNQRYSSDLAGIVEEQKQFTGLETFPHLAQSLFSDSALEGEQIFPELNDSFLCSTRDNDGNQFKDNKPMSSNITELTFEESKFIAMDNEALKAFSLNEFELNTSAASSSGRSSTTRGNTSQNEKTDDLYFNFTNKMTHPVRKTNGFFPDIDPSDSSNF